MLPETLLVPTNSYLVIRHACNFDPLSRGNSHYIRKITCNQFLAGQLTDANTLSKWLSGYVNGERKKTLVDPLSLRASDLITYCITHTDMPVLDAARNLVGADK